MLDATQSAHFFAATRATWSAMNQKGQGRAMSSTLFRIFTIQNQNPSVMRSRTQHVFAGSMVVVGYDR
jgi:hypothetical protein